MNEVYCRYCGAEYPDLSYPKRCPRCTGVVWQNPLPVAVLMQPVSGEDGRTGLVLIRRQDAANGQGLALPGGFVEIRDASCESAAAREFEEETGIAVDAAGITPTHSFCDGTHMILFMRSARILSQADALKGFRPSAESIGIAFAYAPETLMFPSHTLSLASYLARRAPVWPQPAL